MQESAWGGIAGGRDDVECEGIGFGARSFTWAGKQKAWFGTTILLHIAISAVQSKLVYALDVSISRLRN